MAEIQPVLRNILNVERRNRESGERELQRLLKNSAVELFNQLINFITSGDSELSTLACVLLRKKFADEGYIKALSSHTASEGKAKIFQLINPALGLPLLKKVGDILLSLSTRQASEAEFLGLLVNWSNSESPIIQELSLYLFESSASSPSVFALIEGALPTLSSIAADKLTHDTNLQAAAASMVLTVMSQVQPEQLSNFSQPFQMIIETNICQMPSSLCRLTELTEQHPIIWANKTQELLKFVAPIAKNPKIPAESRISAVEILKYFIRSELSVVRNVYFLQEVTTLAFLLLAEPEKPLDMEGWAQDLQDVYEEGPFAAGLELLRVISRIQESEEIIKTLIDAHFASAHWIHVNAAVTALQVIKKVEISSLIGHMNSSPRIQWSLLKSLGALCIESSIGASEHSLIIHIVLNLASNACAKVAMQALNCLSLYLTSLIRDELSIELTVAPYLDSLASALLSSLGNTLLLSSALSSLSLLITYTSIHFEKYSGTFLPGLRVLINSQCTTIGDQNIRAEAVRCAGCLFECASDLREAHEVFLDIWRAKTGSNEEDPVFDAAWDVLPQFARRIPSEVASGMNEILGEAIRMVEADIDIHLSEALEAVAGYDQLTVVLQGVGERTISMNTMKLQGKVLAAQSIYYLIQALGPLFEPWLLTTLNAIGPLIGFPYNQNLRKYIMKGLAAMPKVFNSSQLLSLVLPRFFDIIQNHLKTKQVDLLNSVKYLQKFLDAFSNISAIGLSTAQMLSVKLLEILNKTLAQRAETSQKLSRLSPETSKLEISSLNKIVIMCGEITRHVSEIICCLLKSFNTQFKGIFLECYQRILEGIIRNEDSSDVEILAALCLFVDYVEFTQDLNSYPSGFLLQTFIKYCYHVNVYIRQTSSYAIGVCAEKSPTEFSAYLHPSIDALQFILTLADAKGELLVSSESAAGALAKVALRFQPDLIPLWLSWLPFQTDPKEAQETHMLFLNNLSRFQQYNDQVIRILSALKTSDQSLLDAQSQSFLRSINV